MLQWGHENGLPPPPLGMKGIHVPVRRSFDKYSTPAPVADYTQFVAVDEFFRDHPIGMLPNPMYDIGMRQRLEVGLPSEKKCGRMSNFACARGVEVRPILDLTATQLVAAGRQAKEARLAAEERMKCRRDAQVLEDIELIIEQPEYCKSKTLLKLVDREMMAAVREAYAKPIDVKLAIVKAIHGEIEQSNVRRPSCLNTSCGPYTIDRYPYRDCGYLWDLVPEPMSKRLYAFVGGGPQF